VNNGSILGEEQLPKYKTNLRNSLF